MYLIISEIWVYNFWTHVDSFVLHSISTAVLELACHPDVTMSDMWKRV